MSKTSKRRPTAFKVEDVERFEPPVPAPVPAEPTPLPVTRTRALPALGRGLRWGSILFAALGGLVGLAASLWLYDWALSLIARNDWIGWTAVTLLGLVLFALVAIILREVAGLARLGRLGKIRHEADSAARRNDKPLAVDVADRLKRLYSGRKDLAWGLTRLGEHEHDIMNAGELLRLTERTLVAPLDPYARGMVASSAKRVSVVTAVRPGTLSLLRLARMVVTHIVLTGGIAIGDDVIQQMIGHGLTAKLSARLGEGLFNGALTTRIGIAAIDVCRPLPYIESQRPRFRELVAEVAGIR